MQFKESLKDTLSQEELGQLKTSYDVVGDIAILTIPDSLVQHEHVIAQVVLDIEKRIKVVAKRVGCHGGECRLRKVQIIGGENRKETCVREYGIRLHLHVEKVYFSVRSGSERRRVAGVVGGHEKVLVLFSGVAPFPLMIARYSSCKQIIGIEKNHIAHEYGVANVRLNKKEGMISLLYGDAQVIVPCLNDSFDRVVMPLPTAGEMFLPVALKVLKRGGNLHFYDFQEADSLVGSVEKVRAICQQENRQYEQLGLIKCGHCGPRLYRVCVDGRVL